jgi:hypothetical protein
MHIYSPRSKPQARLERWVLRLQPYDFEVQYIPGKSNIADPLSRLISQTSGGTEKSHLEDLAFVRFIAINATPRALTTRELERESEVDPEVSEVAKCVQFGNWADFKGPAIYKSIRDELCVVGKLVLRNQRIVMPAKYRSHVIELAHEGHLGVVGTKQALRTKVFWPGMDKQAEKYCKSCHGCQVTGKPPQPEPIRCTKLPSSPWSDIAVDFLGPLPSGEHILVVVDYFSRWFEIAYMKSITADQTIKELNKIFFTHGLPKSIRSDNGPQFRSTEFREYCEHLGINHFRVIPKWPQANGEVERQNASLLKRIRIAFAENRDQKAEVFRYMAAYRSNAHPATGKSPAELLYGRKFAAKFLQSRTV